MNFASSSTVLEISIERGAFQRAACLQPAPAFRQAQHNLPPDAVQNGAAGKDQGPQPDRFTIARPSSGALRFTGKDVGYVKGILSAGLNRSPMSKSNQTGVCKLLFLSRVPHALVSISHLLALFRVRDGFLALFLQARFDARSLGHRRAAFIARFVYVGQKFPVVIPVEN